MSSIKDYKERFFLPKVTDPSPKKSLIFIIIFFLSSRLIFFFVGIRFDARTLNWWWHFVDPVLLKNNLLESLYYLHCQPPLFNFFLGCILKLFPNNEILAFNVIYIILGMVLISSLFLLMHRLGISIKLSAILTVLFIVSPACVLYENWLLYTYPVATFLCASGLFLHRFLSNKRLLEGIIFFGLLASIVLIRSLFHILWFVLFLAIILVFQREDWKRIALAACIPFIVVLSVYTKNFCIFGTFSASSWTGMHVAKITTQTLSMEERIALVNQGRLSEFALIYPFSSVEEYSIHLPRREITHIPVLDQQLKSTVSKNLSHVPKHMHHRVPEGSIKSHWFYANRNNIAYININKKYLRDAVNVLIFHPEAYLRGLKYSWFVYFIPASDYPLFYENREKMRYFDKFYNTAFYGAFNVNLPFASTIKKHAQQSYSPGLVGLFLIIAFPIFMIFSFVLILNVFLKKPKDVSFRLTSLFICLNVIYVTLVANSVEIGENMRFRFLIDPFYYILFGLLLNSGLKILRKRSLVSEKPPKHIP